MRISDINENITGEYQPLLLIKTAPSFSDLAMEQPPVAKSLFNSLKLTACLHVKLNLTSMKYKHRRKGKNNVNDRKGKAVMEERRKTSHLDCPA